MITVTVTSKFLVVIPRAVRDRLNIQPGQKDAGHLPSKPS